ncbi:hypothetical protein SDC9_71578 [bioreactor metagenome]|uniref:HTH cro/C1-type domain-containing protein n=1 Tax=bioreactor metagenome TaxID=1076179 RepID=A0A644YAW9_9ZZZZ
MSTESILEKFPEYIRLQRTSRGLTLRRVAEDIGVDPAVLSKTERGIRQAPQNLVVKLAEYYSLDEASLLKIWMQSKWSRELSQANTSLSEPVAVYAPSRIPSFQEIKQKIGAILRKDKRVLKAYLFGSFSRNEETQFSDIDILLKIDSRSTFTLFDIAAISHESEKALGRKIDIVTERALDDKIRESINRSIKTLYEKK